MTTNLAIRTSAYDDAELSALGEHIEARAWMDLFAAAPDWLREVGGLRAEQIGGALALAASGLDHLLFNRVIGLGEAAPATEDGVRRIVGRYAELGIRRFWVHVGPYARPARLGRLLQDHGLQPYQRSWVRLVRPAQRAPAVETSFRIREATADDATAVASMLGMAFDLPQLGAEVFALTIGRRGWRVYVAEEDGVPAAAAGMFTEGDLSYLAFAATRPEYRNRGAQRALISVRLNAACDAGSYWVAAETGFPLTADEASPSYHNLLRAGFRPVSIRDNYAPPGTRWTR
jgi:ribosomal protein S18 acetylase RimI-like enzyme